MHIIEFAGLPGSGKSTICKQCERSLKRSGYRATNAEVRALMYSGIWRKLFLLRVFLYPKSWKLSVIARRTMPEVKDKAAKSWINRMQQIIFLLDKYEKQGMEYALMDEGFVQFGTSICHDDYISDSILDFEREVFKIAYNGRPCRHYYIDIDKEEVFRRIVERNKPGDRFLFGTKEEIMSRLDVKEKNLNKCLSLLDESGVKRIKLKGDEGIGDILQLLN
ncbi:MAG: adenylyl-sulfate kinase [Lachnospiraceae bacterium]|nr:adenylyl-sulfate kinase [Lachnospiraceae bacterium]